MTTVSIAGGWLINDTWTLRGGFGLILDGEMKASDGVAYEVDPGGLISAGLERHVMAGQGRVPTIDVSLSLGASWTRAAAPDIQVKTTYFAADARLGARAGWSIGGKVFPYAAIRVFGGPVHWEISEEDVTGTDIHHYQLAAGSAVQLGSVAVYAEWAGLGEKALSVGVSTSW